MLVTLRRQGEAVLIGDDIELTIVHIGRSRVRVGIRAPRACRVTAGEDRAAKPAPVPGEGGMAAGDSRSLPSGR